MGFRAIKPSVIRQLRDIPRKVTEVSNQWGKTLSALARATANFVIGVVVRWRDLVSVLTQATVYFVIGVTATICISPFGLSTHIDEIFQDLLVATTADFYPSHTRALELEPAVVVLIDDDTVEKVREHYETNRGARPVAGPIQYPESTSEQFDFDVWPIPYAVHDYILAQIMLRAPEAIMVDIVFQSARPWDPGYRTWGNRLDRARFILSRRGIEPPSLYVAVPNPATSWETGALGTLTSSEADTSSEKAEKSLGRDWVKATQVEWVQELSWYPSSVGTDSFVVQKIGQPLGSPAFQIFRDVCFVQSVPSKLCPSNLGTEDDYYQDMMVRWPLGRPPGLDRIYLPEGCPLQNEEFGQRFWASLNVLVQYFEEFANPARRGWVQDCPPILQIDAADFLPDEDRNLGRLAELIQGRVVFYGAGIDAVPDRTFSPVHGSVYGVQKHAMAFHNLATYGEDYFQRDDYLSKRIGVALWAMTAIVFALSTIYRRADDIAKRGLKRNQHRVNYILIVRYHLSRVLGNTSALALPKLEMLRVLVLVLGSLAAIFLTYFLRISFADVLAIISLKAIIMWPFSWIVQRTLGQF